MNCVLCLLELTEYERQTLIGQEGQCASCATINMMMGGMSARQAMLYYEGTHNDALHGGHRNIGDELIRTSD